MTSSPPLGDVAAPPNAPTAEMVILGSMMDNPDYFIRQAKAENIHREMFYSYRLLFDLVCEFYEQHGVFELLAFVQSLQLSGQIDKVTGHDASTQGAACVADVFGHCVQRGYWSVFVGQIRETYAQRLALTASRKLAESEDSEASAMVLEAALKSIRDVKKGSRRAIHIREATRDFAVRLEAAYHSGDIPGKSTGILQLDSICGGMKPGELWVIGGKPSRGKSVLMLQIASEFAERKDNIGIFSLEMMSHEIVGRMISCMGRLDYGAITQPRTANKGHLRGISGKKDVLDESNIWLDSTGGQTLDSICAEAVEIRDTLGGMDLLVVDYLQLIQGQRGRNETREQEIARASGGLKQLAKELNCTVLTGSQLNENGQTRESRAIEQDADALLFIVEDGVKIGKLRNGKRNDILPLYLHGKFQKFLETRPPEDP